MISREREKEESEIIGICLDTGLMQYAQREMNRIPSNNSI